MAFSTPRRLQAIAAAVTLSMAGWAAAQTAEAPPPPSPAHAEGAAPKPAPKHHGHTHKKSDHRAKHHHHKKGDPAVREAAAARQAQRQGQLDGRQGETQFERNALARCEVFKTDLDRQACVERVRNGQVSGSVEGGGTITEYVQKVQVNP